MSEHRTSSSVDSLDHISVCICTYRRVEMLKRLLDRLELQETDNLFSYSAVVVDNDEEESGRQTVLNAQSQLKFHIEYHIEPERSISLARNRAVKSAGGRLIAFIDDDEFPEDDWLLKHYRTLLASEADGVLGPVKPDFSEMTAAWLVKSGLLERKTFRTGETITDWHHTRTGNVLLWKRLFLEEGGLFDPAYGKSGGGDAVFFKRMMEKGRTFVWCNEATVYETVPLERQRKSYYLKRAFTRGMTSAWEVPFLSLYTVRSAVAIVLYTSALPLSILFGQHVFMRYLVRDCDHVGKILRYFGITLVKERPY